MKTAIFGKAWHCSFGQDHSLDVRGSPYTNTLHVADHSQYIPKKTVSERLDDLQHEISLLISL